MIVRTPMPDVSVVVPAHNEATNLPTLIAEIAQVEHELPQRFEIVIIDDFSSDETSSVLEKLAANYPSLTVRRMQRQSGQSAALSAGFDVAQAEIVVTMDADLQNDPSDIPKLLAGLEEADVAIGWRRDRKDPVSKKVISKVANAIRNWMTGECVRDTGCGLKAFKAKCLAKIHRFDGMHRFFPTLVKMHGYSVVEVPVNHRPRTRGRTHYNIFNRSLRPMADLLAVRWLQKRTLRYALQEEKVVVSA
ncbi:Undecaprenyl-phosphate 4-deoxy-4-formamido-L-arabinose transferase [Planctomycetes bacterium Pan216]|uniref:Undecaprenyl-phosphate 4-deoxy-4-formamido-L-arabinose transferase n=1 Tax=Kolteria novifilia TaxID=2527975 RepID=A0A518AXS2_9BACT|nr:Undecaprenyl-phosphate 4-deoxy-4-formamido-L-arabinose transferase [Planctomycetes bacterium Pan216]